MSEGKQREKIQLLNSTQTAAFCKRSTVISGRWNAGIQTCGKKRHASAFESMVQRTLHPNVRIIQHANATERTERRFSAWACIGMLFKRAAANGVQLYTASYLLYVCTLLRVNVCCAVLQMDDYLQLLRFCCWLAFFWIDETRLSRSLYVALRSHFPICDCLIFFTLRALQFWNLEMSCVNTTYYFEAHEFIEVSTTWSLFASLTITATSSYTCL